MRSTLKSMLRWFEDFHHPSPGKLMESIDGELSTTEESKLRDHVTQCERCRARLEQLRAGLTYFNTAVEETSQPFRVEEGLQQLTSKLQQHDLSVSPRQIGVDPMPARALYDRLLAELSIYIGRRTAIRLLDRCNHDMLQREGFSQVVEPVVTAFLGKQAGAAVLANVLRIWDRTQQVPS